MSPYYPLIALTGHSRQGKDEAATPLIAAGWTRRCFGDTIKAQLDPLVREQLGFSAFTQRDEEKTRIRGLLELWGDVNYDRILAEFFGGLPAQCVNTRLCRVREAREWVARGGILVEVTRPDAPGPFTPWERETMEELRAAVPFAAVVVNDGTVDDLHTTMRRWFVDGALHHLDRPGPIRCRGAVHAGDRAP